MTGGATVRGRWLGPRSTDRTLLIGTALGTGLVATLVTTASGDDGIVLCPYRRCTGGYCPGCGLTRGANRLIRGDVGASWAQHPWVLLAALQALVVAGGLLLLGDRHRRSRLGRFALPLAAANGVLLVAIWLTRLAGGTIPAGWF